MITYADTIRELARRNNENSSLTKKCYSEIKRSAKEGCCIAILDIDGMSYKTFEATKNKLVKDGFHVDYLGRKMQILW